MKSRSGSHRWRAAALLLLALAATPDVLAHADGPAHPPAASRPSASLPALPVAAVSGRVIADPRHLRRVDAPAPGLVEPPEQGFPAPGAAVRAGQVLAYVVPSYDGATRADLLADQALARRDAAIGALKMQRFNVDETRQFDGSVALPSLEILGESRSASGRVAALDKALTQRLAIVAAGSGRLVRAHIRTGSRVNAGEPLFEILSPDRVLVEVIRPDTGGTGEPLQRARLSERQTAAIRLDHRVRDAASRSVRDYYVLDTPAAPLPLGRWLSLTGASP